MENLHQVQDSILAAYAFDIIDDIEFLLLSEINSSSNQDFEHDDGHFDLDNFNDDECTSYYRFKKDEIYRLKHALGIPDRITLPNRSRMDGLKALCIGLQRYANPCRYGDLVKVYRHPVPLLCLAFNWMTKFIYDTHKHRLTTLDQPWLAPQQLRIYADVIHQKGAPLKNCWGFVDVTVRAICKPGEQQQQQQQQQGVDIDHKPEHLLKYQSVTTPNGMIANLYGPVEGRRHDSYLLRESGLLTILEGGSHDAEGNVLCIYGDPRYPVRPQLQAPFPTANITPDQAAFNEVMSKVKITAEWSFGGIVNFFKLSDFKKSQEIHESSCAKMYMVSGILTNAHTCIYGNNTPSYFQLKPPSLDEYFQ
ncbi:uncharacterized protein LOC593936 isoform X1 [Strongylocentrotus purpuratus]|uniref:DDE Tnp4 domain-containing protein n=1 Tax=Strongylocentrotus purpuratus TaxID=7668 RepID=A0A7M7RHP0_STRPU|nr:uncharacterized protein LOC593936 isoform X2 [Strongylocentrotus purpuratus]XP_800792.2 uncharacterized protein LOC593936 isoform X1 [Strongylocentrotus purpuratus]